MKPGRRALGKGLGDLLSAGRGGLPTLHEISVDDIVPNPQQPRKTFDPRRLEALAETIRAKGVTQPVLVRRAGDKFELIAGERRWRAARQAGLRTVPAVLRDVNTEEALELALIENLQREDLNPVEEAASYAALLKRMTQEEVAARMGKDRATVANAVRLLKLPREVLDAVVSGALSAGHARAILQLDTPAAQVQLARRVMRDKLSVRQTEAATQRRPGAPPPAAGSGGPHGAIAEELSTTLGTKVRVARRGKRGAFTVSFYSDEEFDRLVQLFRSLGS